jgi:hypothetical protein
MVCARGPLIPQLERRDTAALPLLGRHEDRELHKHSSYSLNGS